MTKYNDSFDVDFDDIPEECPICKHEFDLNEVVDHHYHKDGIRSMLSCPNGDCNFKKALSYITNDDAEKGYNEFLNSVDDED